MKHMVKKILLCILPIFLLLLFSACKGELKEEQHALQEVIDPSPEPQNGYKSLSHPEEGLVYKTLKP